MPDEVLRNWPAPGEWLIERREGPLIRPLFGDKWGHEAGVPRLVYMRPHVNWWWVCYVDKAGDKSYIGLKWMTPKDKKDFSTWGSLDMFPALIPSVRRPHYLLWMLLLRWLKGF